MPKAQEKKSAIAKANMPDKASSSTETHRNSAEVIIAVKELKANLKGDNESNNVQLGQEINGKLDNIAYEVQHLS